MMHTGQWKCLHTNQKQTTYCWLLVLGLSLIIAACDRSPSAAPEPPVTGTLTVHAPDQVLVGTDVPVTVRPGNVPNGTEVTLIVLSGFGPHVFQTTFQDGQASFVLPEAVTRYAGHVDLVVTSGPARGVAQIDLLPDQPAEPVVPLVGPRSIIADGKHAAMVVTVPMDRFDNPVADGTPVQLRVLHPDNEREDMVAHVHHGVAWATIVSHTRAGRTAITAATAHAYGPEATLLEIAGWPEAITISADPEIAATNSRQPITLRTEIMRDRFGNITPDGTVVTFLVETSMGTEQRIPAITIDGVAETSLSAAHTPDVYTIYATLYGVESQPLQVTFTPESANDTFPVDVRADAANQAIIVAAGPLLGPLNQYVPDGTPILFKLTGERDYVWRTATTTAGHANIELRMAELAAGNYTVDVLGGSGTGSAKFRLSATDDEE